MRIIDRLKMFVLRVGDGFRYRKITRDLRALRVLSRCPGLVAGDVEVRRGRVFLPGTEIKLDVAPYAKFLPAAARLAHLRNCCKAVVSAGEGACLDIALGEVRVRASTTEDVLIIHEIFFSGIYNLHMTGPYRAIDVGMNMGTTALFFARDPYCVSVDGFELFPQTCAKAEFNFSRNPHLQGKIRIHPYGLAKADSELELDYSDDYCGSVGIHGIPDYLKDAARGGVKKLRVPLKACVPVFRRVLESSPLPIVLKIDCEGAEYDIFDALADAGLLAGMAVILLEWHARGPDLLLSHLRSAGFAWLAFDSHGPNHGMIYAWKPRDAGSA